MATVMAVVVTDAAFGFCVTIPAFFFKSHTGAWLSLYACCPCA